MQDNQDQFTWLEEVSSPEANSWVAEQNAAAAAALKGAHYKQLVNTLTELNTEHDFNIPTIGKKVIVQHKATPKDPKGKLRICDRREYLKDPIGAKFEVLLDVDQLSKNENENWFLQQEYFVGDITDRCILKLSYGGADTSAYREFDFHTRGFIEAGFKAKGKGTVAYLGNGDHVAHAMATSPENTSKSGYPLEAYIWDRQHNSSRRIFKADHSHLSVFVRKIRYKDDLFGVLLSDYTDFHHGDHYLLISHDTEPVSLPIPKDAEFLEAVQLGNVFFRPESSFVLDGCDYRGGLVALDLLLFLERGQTKYYGIMPAPQNGALSGCAADSTGVYASVTKDVVAKLLKFPFKRKADHSMSYDRATELDLPGSGSVSSLYSIADLGVGLVYTDFLRPTSFYILKENQDALAQPLLKMPDRVETSGFQVKQEWATSKDGTKIPFFIVSNSESLGKQARPTILYGYGGFKISLEPTYSWSLLKSWIEPGGVYVSANIRGGGEYGPSWHAAAQKENRHKSYEDFIAVAERLIELGITDRSRLGIAGASNGGLLVGNALVQKPELFAAVYCAVPLLDMLRYTKLLAGHSWVGEYGDPERQEEKFYLERISPYHNLRADSKYPAVLFMTSRTDDRVHPAHARKMAAKMQSFGLENIFFVEELDKGHNSSDFNNWIPDKALQYTFFTKYLCKPSFIHF
ncbi:MAG: prolyl oligopeptidase family serine peptidase [Oligoflexia bacterium]|nr:prolyl oligopeptidase family serine peptidase [Oligoflexia bacterium]